MSKVKSAAQYLKEFEEFYKDENQEKFEEETEEEKVSEEEEEETARSAPLEGPYLGPEDPLDLFEDLSDALTAAEDRIGKLEAEKAVFQARLARQEEQHVCMHDGPPHRARRMHA